MADLATTEISPQETAMPPMGAWLGSFVLLGLLLFALTDTGLRFLYHPDPLVSSYRSWIASAVNDYPRGSQRRPDVVIFGSSLMVAAVNDGDAATLGEDVDGTLHHRSVTLEKSLAEHLPKNMKPTSQSFAIGGQMASDAYAILRSLFGGLTSNNPSPQIDPARFVLPEMIIWGIAPRDFLDATFTDPYTSTTVMYLDRLSNGRDALGTRKPYFWRELESFIDKLCYVYDQRDHLVVTQKEITYNLLSSLGLVRAADYGKVKTPQEILRIARRELPEDNGVGQWMVKPQTEATTRFEDNSAEYKMRYTPFNQKLFDVQIGYLQKFLLLAKGMGIRVVLVNMPLTAGNMALIPEGKYQLYLDSVKHLAAESNATVIDYNDGKTFEQKYFNDPVHLNGYGSQRFFRMLGEKLAPTMNGVKDMLRLSK